MKRSQSSIADGSLELLLDTICNTFGGIIFIALLLVIMLNTTADSASEATSDNVPQSQLIQAETQREKLTNKLSRLRRAESAQKNTISGLLSDDVVKKAKLLKQEEKRHTRLIQEKSEVVGSATQSEIEINKLEAEIEKNKRQLQNAEKEAALLRKKISAAVNEKARHISIPKLSHNNLTTLSYMLVRGKLYGPVISLDVSGKPTVRNSKDFTFSKTNGVESINPIPESGLLVDAGGANTSAIRRKLSSAKHGRNSVELYVSDDSYRHFDSVRLALEESGLPVAPIPIGKDRNIIFVKNKDKEKTQG